MSDTYGVDCGVWPLLLKRSKFKAACEWHDQTYTKESWAQKNLSRYEVDAWFKRQMLFIAGDSPLRKLQAHAFYCIVRLVGHLWWEGER